MPDDGSGEAQRKLLGLICEKLDAIRERLAAAGAGPEGEHILAGLRGSGDAAQLEAELHRLLRRSGVAPGLTGVTRGAGIGGMFDFDGHPSGPDVLVCPHSRCLRTVLPADGPQVPRECRLHGGLLRTVRPGG